MTYKQLLEDLRIKFRNELPEYKMLLPEMEYWAGQLAKLQMHEDQAREADTTVGVEVGEAAYAVEQLMGLATIMLAIIERVYIETGREVVLVTKESVVEKTTYSANEFGLKKERKTWLS
jgi:hypothetical protein